MSVTDDSRVEDIEKQLTEIRHLMDADGTLSSSKRKAESSGFKLADPRPVALCAFALTTFLLSLINVQARGITDTGIVTGLALFYGGGVQIAAGLFSFVKGDTVSSSAFCSYGAFWLAFSTFSIPWFNAKANYTTQQFEEAMGMFLMCWFAFSILMLLCGLRSNLAHCLLTLFLSVTFAVLGIGHFYHSHAIIKAGGVTGLITSLLAWYNAFACCATYENSWIRVPVGTFPWAPKIE